MATTDELLPLLKRLKLGGIQESLDLRIRQAIEDNLGHRELLFRLLQDESERRDANQLKIRMRKARFEQEKSLEEFDFSFNPKIPKNAVIDLATCHFVMGYRNVLLVGQTGVGKSHLAQAIGMRACRLGFSTLFLNAGELFEHLKRGRGDGSYERRLNSLVKSQLLIIDDLGLKPLSGSAPLDLYELIRLRYEKGSLLITSNRDEEELQELFDDPLIANAAMDRLLHHCEVLCLEGKSYRGEKSRKFPSKQ